MRHARSLLIVDCQSMASEVRVECKQSESPRATSPTTANESDEESPDDSNDELAALLTTTEEENGVSEEDTEAAPWDGASTLPKLLEEDTQDDDGRPEALDFSPILPKLTESDREDDASNGPNGPFKFELRPFAPDESDDDYYGVNDTISLEPLPDLEADEGLTGELEVGSIALPSSGSRLPEETRFSLLATIEGSFSALCLTPNGVIAAESSREEKSRLLLVHPAQLDPVLELVPRPPGKVLSLAYAFGALRVVTHTGRSSQAAYDGVTLSHWQEQRLGTAAGSALAPRRWHQGSTGALLELSNGQFARLESGGELRLLEEQAADPSDEVVFRRRFESWVAELSANNLTLCNQTGRSQRLPLDAAVGLCMGNVADQTCVWIVVDDFSADRSRLLELDVDAPAPVIVATIPRGREVDDLLVEDTLWDPSARFLYIATTHGLFVLQRLAA